MWIKRILKGLLILGIAGYISICGLLYFYQESLLFFPEKLEQDHQFVFENEFEERDIITHSGNSINTLLFNQENSKGVIFYLHGNSGSLRSVGNVSTHFLPLGYDVLMLDYAGYGKSSSKITSQEELFEDIQDVYDDLKKTYSEDKIVVVGYSIGTGIAAHLASNNNPAKVVLQAPYYSMIDMMERNYPGIPTLILRYDLATNEYLKDCDMPGYLFHGVDDQIIPMESSEMLSKELDLPLYKLENQGHNDITSNKEALKILSKILNE
jgi:hypothetical protein